MLNLQKQWKFCKSIFILLVVIFSLAPCRVKETLLHVFEIQYQVPLNKTRTTLQQGYNCSNIIAQEKSAITKYIAISKNINREERLHGNSILITNFLAENLQEKQPKEYPQIEAKRGPPKYILFKQLKVNLG